MSEKLRVDNCTLCRFENALGRDVYVVTMPFDHWNSEKWNVVNEWMKGVFASAGMTLNAYQAASGVTRGEQCDHLYVGVKLIVEATEAGQMAIKAHYHGKPVDRDALREELGDTLWHIAQMAADHGMTLEEVAAANIEKLRARHGEKYNPEHYKMSQREWTI